tara:strand:+ start:196 stop:579 length:384 start_codon:yes stop_codon:yes gene_type:complete
MNKPIVKIDTRSTRSYNKHKFAAELVDGCGDTSLMRPVDVVKWIDNTITIADYDDKAIKAAHWYREIASYMLENKMQAVIRCMQTDNDDGLEEWLFAGNWEKMPVENIAKEWDELCRQEEEAKKLED